VKNAIAVVLAKFPDEDEKHIKADKAVAEQATQKHNLPYAPATISKHMRTIYTKRLSQRTARQDVPNLEGKKGQARDSVFFAWLKHKYLEWQKSERLAPSLSGANDIEIDWQEVGRAMLKPKRELASNLFTSGMGIKFELDDIHAPLGLVERPQKPQRRDDASPEEGSRVYQEEKEKITPIEYDDFFQQVLANQQSPKSNGKRLNIIGEPGAGKTTQLLKIADWVLDESEGLPIWISLGVVGEKPLQEYLLKDWLPNAAGKLDAAPPEWVEQLEQHLQDGRVWLLLDGADEMQVADPLGKLAEFVRVPLLKNVRVVLTCRLNLWDAAGNALSEFDTYKMLDFSYGDGKNSDQVKQFIDKWFANPSSALPYKEREQEASPRVGGSEGGQQLRKTLDETGKERIKDLARHPLRLALLCFTWQFGRGLPDTKAELYEMFVEALYVLKKGVFFTNAPQQRDLNVALGQLALKAIDNGFKSILPHSLVYEELKKPHPELFELADKLGWLNQVGDEPENRRQPVYAFFHPTFQEYFAACAIPKKENWHFFLKHSDKPTEGIYRILAPKWKEVFLLWLGQPEKEVPYKQKEELIQALVTFEGDCRDFYHYQAYCLAASGLAEFRTCSLSKVILEQIVKWSFGYFDSDRQQWGDFLEPIENLARTALQETNRTIASNALIKRLLTISSADNLDPLKDNRWLVLKTLEKIIVDNQDVIEYITEFVYPSQDESVCLEAISILKTIAPVNRGAISVLTQLLHPSQNKDIRLEAALSLAEIDIGNFQALAALIELPQTYLKAENDLLDWGKVWRIKSVLTNIKPEQLELNNSLTRLLSSKHDNLIRLEAANILLRIGNLRTKVSQTLWDLVDNSQSCYIITSALETLAKIETENFQAISAQMINIFKYCLQNSQPDEKGCLFFAERLGEINPGNSDAIAALLELLQTSKDDDLHKKAIKALGEIAFGNSHVIEVLNKLLHPIQKNYIRFEAAKSLWKINSDNLDVIETLFYLMGCNEEVLLSDEIAKYLEEIAVGNSLVISTLIELLSTAQGGCWWLPEILGKIVVHRQEAIVTLKKLLHSNQDEESRLLAAESLLEIDQHNPDAVKALTELVDSTQDYSICWCAAKDLWKIGYGNEKTLNILIEQICDSTSDEYGYSYTRSVLLDNLAKNESLDVINPIINLFEDTSKTQDARLGAIWLLREIGNDCSEVITALIRCLNTEPDLEIRRSAASTLVAISADNQRFVGILTHLRDTDPDPKICCMAASALLESSPGNRKLIEQAIEPLTKWLLCISQFEDERLDTAKNLEQIDPGNPDAINVMVELLLFSEDWEGIEYEYYYRPSAIESAAAHLKDIRQIEGLTLIVKQLKDWLLDQNNENDKRRRSVCLEVLLHCAQNMSYLDFYQAWHSQPPSTHPEAPDNIPVGNSAEAQILELQNINFKQLQSSHYTFPLTINLLSLQGETDKEEIAQELCIQIYKHPDVDIPGEPPDTFNARQLKKRLFPIKAKLQGPNLALVLYIKDANGFHEPTEEAIAFCQKIADPDLGIHIAWITNQSLEQPLKDIQPDPLKLISKIQSWIDEIV
jgi:HEAT repeat protein/energy-coupling factor transporter ATP-binding protein EcfA2